MTNAIHDKKKRLPGGVAVGLMTIDHYKMFQCFNTRGRSHPN